MTKEELVHLTLKQLRESLKVSPENFRFEDPASATVNGSFPGPTVIWQFRVKIDEDKFIPDPLNSVKTIIVTYNKMSRQLSCFIYNREVNNLNHAMMPEAQTVVKFNDHIPAFCYSNYRLFCKLQEELVKRRNDKEYADYMRRLNGIFPATHEDELFKP